MDALTTHAPGVRFCPKESREEADICIIIVSWNVADLLAKNLDTLRKSAGNVTARIVVVDNASTDGTVRSLQDASDVLVIANAENAGFAHAVDQGMAIAHSRHVLLLNPDMRVSTDALQRTVDELDRHADIGVLGCRLLNDDGTVLRSVRRLPDVWSQLAILLKLPHLVPSLTSRYLFTDLDDAKAQDVPSVRGSFFAISHAALAKVGTMDERFFIWFEEVDYCKRTFDAGLRVRYEPSITAVDLVGRSFVQRRRYWRQREFTRSMARYFWKWHPGWQAVLISCVRPFPVAAAWIADRISR